MSVFISVVIPNYKGRKSVGKCLEALYASSYRDFEVIVVDDGSTDGSEEIIRDFPCKLIRFPERRGASAARNEGARNASGEALFFIDSDCVVLEDTLSRASGSFRADAVVGGTYTPLSYDGKFFSDFQSLFINYFETKSNEPDYIAAHAMLIGRKLFLESGGFPEKFLPIIEDVELSHRLRMKGIRLIMDPGLMVRHIFNFSLFGSLRNAFRKSLYWTVYSVRNRDIHRDSGTASIELKINTLSWFLCAVFVALFALSGKAVFAAAALMTFLTDFFLNRKLFLAICRATNPVFAMNAFYYYMLIYPVAIGAGGLAGLLRALRR